jgi:hypothetical protein
VRAYRPVLAGTPDASTVERKEVNMSPFIAALIAGGYMGCVIAIFGAVPRFLHRAH